VPIAATRVTLLSPTTTLPTILLTLLLHLIRLLMESLWGLYFWRCCNKAGMKIMARRETFTRSYCEDPTLLSPGMEPIAVWSSCPMALILAEFGNDVHLEQFAKDANT
jgi:hypothetical protein